MASKHLWIAELQDRDGKAVEYHSLELEPEHYDKGGWNRAMTSWSNFRQRERGNLKCNRPRNSRCKWAVSWRPADDAAYQIFGLPEGIKHHKTIWDLYEAIGYNYKAKKYERAVTIVAIDPGSEDSMVETTFEDGKLVQIRTLEPEAKTVTEEKRMRGDVPGMVHIDESGFMDEQGNPVYVATGDGKSTTFLLNERTAPIPEKIGVVTSSSNAETATVTERAALGAGVLAEPASLEEANRLRAKVGLEPLLAQPAPEGFEFTAPHPEGWQEPAPEVQVIKNPFNGMDITGAQAAAIAAKVNAEPDVEKKKQLLVAELKFHAEAQVRNAVSMPGARNNDPRMIAHKKKVVKAHQKIKRQQARAEKMKALQVKAFSGK